MNNWHRPQELLPAKDEFVLCILSSNGYIVSGWIYKDERDWKYKIMCESCFEFDDYGDYEVEAWCKIPEGYKDF